MKDPLQAHSHSITRGSADTINPSTAQTEASATLPTLPSSSPSSHTGPMEDSELTQQPSHHHNTDTSGQHHSEKVEETPSTSKSFYENQHSNQEEGDNAKNTTDTAAAVSDTHMVVENDENNNNTNNTNSRAVKRNPRKFVQCEFQNCTYQTDRVSNLRNHIRTHTGDKPYSCHLEGCEYISTQLSNLRAHLLRHKLRDQRKANVEIKVGATTEDGTSAPLNDKAGMI